MTARLDAFLMHFGVKGMKWGVRKDEPAHAGFVKTDSPSTSTRPKNSRTNATAVAALINQYQDKKYSDLKSSQGADLAIPTSNTNSRAASRRRESDTKFDNVIDFGVNYETTYEPLLDLL